MRLALTTGSAERSFRLRDGIFAVDGQMPTELSSEDALDSPALTQVMPVGSYDITLLDGWHLERLEGALAEPVDATLVSENPLAFSIEAGATTQVSFRFQTADAELALGDGNLAVSIAVDEVSLQPIVITEIMKDPSVLVDTAGEWFEVHNPGDSVVQLEGCSIVRDTTQTTIAGPLEVAPGGYATIARTSDPGFVPNYVLPSLSLPNAAAVSLSIACSGATLDQVVFDTASFPNEAGRSLSLSSTALDAFANDLGSNWCPGVDDYNGDLASPGGVNPPCP